MELPIQRVILGVSSTDSPSKGTTEHTHWTWPSESGGRRDSGHAQGREWGQAAAALGERGGEKRGQEASQARLGARPVPTPAAKRGEK